jgi:hypothetical protein
VFFSSFTRGGCILTASLLSPQVWKYLWNRLRAVRVEYKLQGFFEQAPRDARLASCVHA